MLGCVVLISPSSSPTFFSPLHKLLMILSRIGADITRNTSAALSKTASDSEKERSPAVGVAADAKTWLLLAIVLLAAGATPLAI